jgi:hypothetical protein
MLSFRILSWVKETKKLAANIDNAVMIAVFFIKKVLDKVGYQKYIEYDSDLKVASKKKKAVYFYIALLIGFGCLYQN